MKSSRKTTLSNIESRKLKPKYWFKPEQIKEVKEDEYLSFEDYLGSNALERFKEFNMAEDGWKLVKVANVKDWAIPYPNHEVRIRINEPPINKGFWIEIFDGDDFGYTKFFVNRSSAEGELKKLTIPIDLNELISLGYKNDSTL